MFNLKQILKTAIIDLSKNTIRTILTSLGILIGVLAVVLLVAFGQGLKNYILQQLEDLGSNVVYVYPGDPLEGTGQAGGGMLGTIKFDDRDFRSLETAPLAKYVIPVFVKRTNAETVNETKLTDVFATTPDIFKLRNLGTKVGRLFTASDVSKRAKIAVLGPKIARELFGSESSAIGKSIRLINQRYRIVGVLNEQGGTSFGGPDYDSYTYIPYTAATAFNPKNEFFSFYVAAYDKNQIPELRKVLEQILLKRYKEDDFSVIEPTEIMELFGSILGIVNAVLVAIGSISLLVGGIGIMNIMYTSVMERTKEVGVRRALGATKTDILYLFLSQSVILSLIGGLLGLGLAALIVALIQRWFPASLNLLSIFIALFVSSGIGIFFGVFPALKAAHRHPIEAIRYE